MKGSSTTPTMLLLATTTTTSSLLNYGHAFTFTAQPQQQQGIRIQSRLFGLSEWRDESLESYYSLDSYTKKPSSSSSSSSSSLSPIPSSIPILPFPFPDLLLQGQRTQLNLYEDRFHKLFDDVMTNYCGVVAMGLLAGNGMITTLPLCEVESYSKMGDDNTGGGGNENTVGSIFVTIRAVGRAKIVEAELTQEEPYMVAKVQELMDIDEEFDSIAMEEEASELARGIELAVEELAVLEERWEEMERESVEMQMKKITEGKKVVDRRGVDDDGEDDGASASASGQEVMNRRLVNAKLESLFLMEDNEGILLEEGDSLDNSLNDDEEEEEEDDDDDDDDDLLERVAQFREAIEMAKETDTNGYITTTAATTATPTNNDISNQSNQQPQPSQQSQSQSQQQKPTLKSPKDLTAISWAAFCTTGESYNKEGTVNIAQDVYKIQALDMTSVVSRLKLALGMLREEEKKWRAKLALKGVILEGSVKKNEGGNGSFGGGDGSEDGGGDNSLENEKKED